VLVKEFKGVLYTIPLYGAVYIAYAACKLVSAYTEIVSATSLHDTCTLKTAVSRNQWWLLAAGFMECARIHFSIDNSEDW
jgi:hypothetical protein